MIGSLCSIKSSEQRSLIVISPAIASVTTNWEIEKNGLAVTVLSEQLLGPLPKMGWRFSLN